MGIPIQPSQEGDFEFILNQKTYTTFDGGKGWEHLPKLCHDLLSEQKRVWPDLRQGYELLKNVRERKLSCSGFSVRLQHNPGRIKSSLADVGEKDRKDLQCFLCLNHLPEGQKGILYRSDFLILCNPMPVFSPHFTVSHIGHCCQAIAEHINAFLQLMADFGPGWTVLYNGPRCGASAPDHLHFQAGPSGQMPIEKEIQEEKKVFMMTQVDGVSLYRMRDLGREAVLLEGDEPESVGKVFKSFLSALQKLLLIDAEPMMNVVGFREEKKWHLVIFPRRKHRPDAFFRQGDARMIVSPGVIDMGGTLITPVKKDFDRLDGAGVESIYAEVSMDRTVVESAIHLMTH